MTIRDLKGSVENKIPVQNVIVSVFDKTGLDDFIPGLVDINPRIMFISTGGTYKKLAEILGNCAENNLMEVSEYTGFPEMEGGLVKTLHPKLHAGILGERNNPEHQKYLKEDLNNAVYIDMVVVNLYPFEKVISQPNVTFEKARGNIDIGGPAMLRAAAKNFLSCAAVCDPRDYDNVLKVVKNNDSCTTLIQRLSLARNVFELTSEYDTAISLYMWEKIGNGTDVMKIAKEYVEGGR